MMTRHLPKSLLLPLFAVAVFLVACSDTDATDSAPGSGQGGVDTSVSGSDGEATPSNGAILVSSSAITGHEGHILLVFGPGTESEICAAIDSDPWTLPEEPLTDRGVDADPCSGDTGNTVFGPGEHAVTASIFDPGSQTPLASTAALAQVVDGDVQIELDGGALSGAAEGDPGRILVTVSEITGQAGKMLMVLGQNNAASLCVVIDADPWTLSTPTAMTELPGADSGPCGEGTPEVSFPAGGAALTAAVLVPGSQSADVTTPLIITVDGDALAAIDGAKLSG